MKPSSTANISYYSLNNVIYSLISTLKNDTSKETIIKTLEKVCLVVSIEYTVCQTIVDYGLQQLLDLIARKVDSETTCKKMGLCD